jgi:fucose 4-O-acetylase-like acetyltransferase
MLVTQWRSATTLTWSCSVQVSTLCRGVRLRHPTLLSPYFYYVNNASLSRILLECGDFNGIDMSSQSLMLQLNAGDTLSLFVKTFWHQQLRSISQLQRCQLPNVTDGLFVRAHSRSQCCMVAWFPYGTSLTIYGPTNINFTTVFVDTSSAWNSSTASLRVPVQDLLSEDIRR